MQSITTDPIIVPSLRELHEFTLIAPDVKVAFHDEDNFGLIPVSALQAPLVVDFPVWAAAQPGYQYAIIWNAAELGERKVIQESDQPGDTLTLEVPVESLVEGVHQLQYLAFNPSSEVTNTSKIFTVVIDTTPAGDPELSAILFPVEIQNGLTLAELAQLGGKLDGQVAGYTGMAKHDVIQTWWGDVLGPTATVTESDMGLDRVVVTFDKAFLESIGEGEKAVKYVVFDRAGNPSIDSNSVPVLLKLREIPENFPAPIIDPQVLPLIDHNEARAGVKVDIPHYPGASAYDLIQLYWGEDNGLTPVQLTPGNENEPVVLSLKVPFEALEHTPVGTVNVHYSVTRQGEPEGRSLVSTADVFLTLPVPEPMQALVIQGTSVENPNTIDNFIDEDDYELNGRAIVAWNDSFAVSDDLNLHWGDQVKLQWYQIRSSDVAAGINLTLPIDNTLMKAQGTGAQIPVHFTLTRTNNPNPVKSPVQQVTVRSKEELPGGSDGLLPPPFKLNGPGYIAPILNPDGADIKIAPYINIAESQLLTLTFKGFDDDNNPIEEATYIADRRLDRNDVLNGYTFTVPDRNLRLICTGFAEAWYRVEPPEGTNQSAVNSPVNRAPVHMLDAVQPTCLVR
ncbi:hypothetical protein PSCI_3663 [Pseudomonas sp. StFLB209]|uniref:hypothetical protein n=1 Tax=Pseudomonas sp. StFLB209 TaxID=1028989 RepID=UPI0004F5CA67|nr:hypothetical protein [Pseudomonas sp. StFLB209]BAP44365.1 hypothetical protein PSCI_3663 [Pseudomonas sp. StFLB209]